MTAESVVVNQISEDSKVQNEDKGLDEEIIAPKVAGDLKNGVNEHASNAKEETEDYDNNTNSNAIGLGDPDLSYVFVSRKDSRNGDSIDWDLNVEGAREKDIIPEPEVVAPLANHVNGQLKEGEPESDNGEILFPKDNDCIAECPVIFPSDSTIGPDISPVQLNVENKDVIVAQDQNARASVASEQEQPYPEAIEEHVEPVSAPDLKENQESSPLVLEVGTFDDGKIKFEEQTAESGAVLEPHEQADMESTIELGKVQDSHFLIPEAVNLHEATEKAVEENHLNSTAQCNESEEAHVSFSEASELALSSPNNIKENSEEETEIEPTAELGGSQEYQAVVSEATECGISEVEVGKVSSSEQAESSCEAKENPKAQSAMPESEESESSQLDNGGEKLKEEEKTDFGVSMKEYEESQLTVNGNPGSNLNQGNRATKLSTETNISLEPENGFENVLADNQDGCPTSQLEGKTSAIQDLYESVDASQKTTVQNGSSKNDNNLPLPDGCVRPETEDGIEPVGNNLCPVKDGKVAVEVEKMTDEGNEISNCKEMNSESDIGLSIDSEGKEINSSCHDVKTETEFPNMVTDGACGQPLSASDLIPVCHTNGSVPIESSADRVPKSEVENLSSANGMDVSCTDAVIPRSQVQFGSFVPGCQVNSASGDDSDCFTCQERKDFKQVPKNEVSTSSPKGFSTDVVIEQNVAVESVKRPFNFLIRIPRYDDEEHREQIRQAQLQVEQKTQQRDAIRFKIQMIRGNHQQIHSEYEAAKSEERAARGLVRLKRQEIDSVQSVINRVKNAISVEDIDVRINHMEHMIQHETLPLKEEKQFIREIKQLKHHREQLSSNMGSQDEVQQALDQRDQIEERLKILKKELDRLKDKVSIAEATAVATGKKYNDESKRLKELHAQFRAADDVRQEAYMKLQNLRRQLYEKNGRFRTYKDDVTAANEYASSRDKGALHCLCLSQVEKMMELWNNDDEFRKEYIRFNTKSTLRRLRTLDGRALGPDEESPVLPSVVDERIDVSLHQVGQPNSELLISDLEKEKLLSTVEAEKTEGKSIEEVAEQMDKTEKTKKPGKPTMRTGSPSINGRDETGETLEEEHEQTKEQEEARKERQFRKEEEEAKLKEQRRLEEIAKAKEALERKRKNAEKAQIRAEVRAQKEAEQKEKEREKKAKKKERKKAGAGAASENGNEGDIIAASLESSITAIKEPEIKEGPATVTKRPQKVFSKQQSKTKSIPPPLRNKNKRRMQQWMWIIFTVMLVLAVILLGNIGFYSNLGRNRQMRSSGF